MKFLTGSLAAALVLITAGAQAQAPYEVRRAPYAAVSDIGGPYVALPHEVPGPRYGYGPSLLPATEVYTVLRENGFSPLGIPRLRGWVYTIAVIDRGGEDGRLVISARNGRIIRFVPAYRAGDQFEESSIFAPRPHVMAPPLTSPHVAVAPPPGPKVASHSVPIPKAKPLAAKPAAAEPAQAAAPQPKPAEVQAAAPPAKPADVPAAAPEPKPAEVQAAAPAATVTTGSAPAKPAPSIAPTQEMPGAQGLE
jgi:hypothetical protein